MKPHVLVAILGLATLTLGAQQAPMDPNLKPTFEVASIRPADPTDQNQGFNSVGRHIVAENETVLNLIMVGYGVHPKQILSEPSWVDHTMYTIDGVPDAEGQPNITQMRNMIRQLLKDRFHLKCHIEKREIPVYAVQIAKGGSKLLKSKADPNSPPNQTGGDNWMDFSNTSMEMFALTLQFMDLDRPAVDETGLTGKFDFALRWTTTQTQDSGSDSPPSLFAAIQEQAGLKLEPKRAMAEVLIVDSVEKPSDN